MSFCTQCGAALDAGGAFCTACGAMVAPTTPPPRATPAPVSSMPNAPAPKPTPWGKILAVLLVLVVLLVGSVIGGLVYVGYRVKKKVAEFTRTENAPSTQEAPSGQAPPENRDSGKSPANSPKNNQNEQVSKALDGIGGLMDRLGFGDPPPTHTPTCRSPPLRKSQRIFAHPPTPPRNSRRRQLPKSAPAASPCARDS